MDGAVETLTVTYTGEPEVVFEFREEGESRQFGRDDVNCEIVIWSAIRGNGLSRVAGRIWRMDGELWLRNLSYRHELYLQQAGHPPEAPLPPRLDDGIDRGPARAIPPGEAFVRGPDGCELLIRQTRPALDPVGLDPDASTTRLSPVPEKLLPIAAALCEPLVAGGQLPATYAQISRRLGITHRQARVQVAKLCAGYAHEIPALRTGVAGRLRREWDNLDLPGEPTLMNGLWVFPENEDQDDPAAKEPEEVARRKALALPDYYEVAHLLVRCDLLTEAHLDVLPPPDDEDED